MASNVPDGGKGYNPSNLEKKLLVWFKKYPSFAEVPDSVPLAQMNRVKDSARIRMNLLFMGVFSIGFFFMALRGRNERESGASVTQHNIDWHAAYNDPKNVDRIIPEIKR